MKPRPGESEEISEKVSNLIRSPHSETTQECRNSTPVLGAWKYQISASCGVIGCPKPEWDIVGIARPGVGNIGRNEIIPVKLTFHNLPQRIPRNKENTHGVTRDSANIQRKQTWECGIEMGPVGNTPGEMRGLKQKEEQRGPSGEEISSCSVQTGIGGRERIPHTGTEHVCYGRKGLDLLCRRVVALSGEKKVQLASVQRKASKLNRMYRAAIWALIVMQGALLPFG